MSERTAPALAKLDTLLSFVAALPGSAIRTQLVDEAEALKREVAAFHMEAIRFRMFRVDRMIIAAGDPGEIRRTFDDLRHTLETAGFHTRSHSSP